MFFNAALPNLISAIKVGYITKARIVTVPVNKYLICVLARLSECGAIDFFVLKHRGVLQIAKIHLNYNTTGKSNVSRIRVISTKSNRTYINLKDLRRSVATGRGALILSTTKGVLLGSRAADLGVGGEVILWISF